MGKLVWSGLFMMLLVSGCGWSDTPTRQNDFTPLTSITVTAQYSTIAAKTTTKLTAMGHFSGYFDRDVTAQVTWTSSDANVAAFSAAVPNRVKGLAAGSANVTATLAGLSASCPLTVSPATISTVAVTPATPSVPKGLTQQFAATGTFSDGTTSFTQDITFDATWSSSDITKVIISDLEISKGLATAAGVSTTTTINATFDGTVGSTVMTVTEPVLQSITVLPANPSVLSLENKQFTATGTYSDGSTADITSQATWNSSNTAFATISGGVASTLAPGSTSIGASFTSNGVTVNGSTNLTVAGGSLSSITVTTPSLTSSTQPPALVNGTKTRITATGTFSDGSKRDITGAVTWSVADSTLATVSPAGGNLAWLNAVANTPLTGTVITATGKSADTKTGTATVLVSSPTLSSIEITPGSATLMAKTSSPFIVTATFNDSTKQDVTVLSTWTSNDVNTASVGSSDLAAGRATGVAAGSTNIQASYGGKTVTATVTVTSPVISSLTISSSSGITAGTQVAYTVTANYGDGSAKDVTRDAAWSVGSENVLMLADSINQPGEVIGVSGGSTTLTAAFDGMTKTVTITVP